MLDLVIKLDKSASTRIVPLDFKDYRRLRSNLDSDYRMNRLEPIDELFLADKYDFDKWEKEVEKITKENKESKRAGQELLKKPPQPERRLPKDSPDDLKRRDWHRESFLLEEQHQRALSRRKQFEMELSGAIKLRDADAFYHRVSVDYRGRMYLPAELSYQGSDFARSVIKFSDGMSIVPDAYPFLFQHASNVEGKTDGSVDVRRSEMTKQLAPLTDIVFDPVGKLSEWSDADKPYCFLRACIEVRNVLAPVVKQRVEELKDQNLKQEPSEKAWTDKMVARCDELPLDDEMNFCLISHLPIELDQSGSAYAHITLMRDDPDLLEKANHGEAWSDLYTGVANRTKENRLDDLAFNFN